MKIPISGRTVGEMSLLEAWDWIAFHRDLEKESKGGGRSGPPSDLIPM